MTRSILSLLAACLFVGLVAGPGCSVNGVGDPCTPDEEYNATFAGFSKDEVNVESKSFQCRTRLCLANHFQGRVSCPYGQDSSGKAPPALASVAPNDPNVKGCVIPGTTIPVDPTLLPGPGVGGSGGMPISPAPKAGKTVEAQCSDRSTDHAVYCSCRCANDQGQTNDGANYCTCPDGFACTQLVTSIGLGDTGLTGAYCIKNGTKYDPGANCGETCDPKLSPCSND